MSVLHRRNRIWKPESIVDAPPPQLITRKATVLVGGKRYQRGVVTVVRGASRIGLADPQVRPAIIVRGYVPPAKRAVLQPIQTKGASRIGLGDPLTKPARLLIGGVRRYRGQVTRTRGGRVTSSADPLTKPAMIVKGQPHPYRGKATILRGAARVGVADPMVRPAIIVRGPTPPGRYARKQPLIGRPARDPAAPPAELITRPAAIVIAKSRRYRTGLVARTKGGALTSATDPRTTPARVLIGHSHKNRGQVVRTKGGRLTSAGDPITQSVRMVSGLVNRSRITWAPQPAVGRPARLGDTDNRQTVGSLQLIAPQQPIAQRAERRQPFANRWWQRHSGTLTGTLTIGDTLRATLGIKSVLDATDTVAVVPSAAATLTATLGVADKLDATATIKRVLTGRLIE